MKGLLFIIINELLKDPNKAIKICNIIYDQPFQQPKSTQKVLPVNVSKKVEPKVDQFQLALRELKSKKNKTQKDKESIGILEAVIKNGCKQ